MKVTRITRQQRPIQNRGLVPAAVALIIFASMAAVPGTTAGVRAWGLNLHPSSPRSLPLSSAQGFQPVRIGVLAHKGADVCKEMWQPTMAYLDKALPGRRFELAPLNIEEIDPAVRNKSIDFLICNPAIYVDLEVRHGSYTGVHDCLRELRMPPYEHIDRMSWLDMCRQYWPWLGAITALIVALSGLLLLLRSRNLSLLQVSGQNRLLLASAGEGICGVDVNGLLMFVNPAAVKMLGFTPEELIGKNLHALTHHTKPDGGPYPETECPIYSACKDGTFHQRRDDFFYRRDGSAIPVSYSTQPIIDAGRISGAVICFQDITERKRTEAALHASEEKHRRLIENSHDIIFTLSMDGVFTYVSPSCTALLGHLPDEVVGKPFQSFVHPDDLAACMAFMKRVVKSRERQEGVEFRVRHADGSWRWHKSNGISLLDASGNVAGIQGNTRDTSERRQAQDALLCEKNIVDAILNSAPGIIYLYDNQAKLARWNKKHEEMTGYSTEELNGRHVLDWFKGDEKSLAAITEGLKNTLEIGFGEAEADLQRKDGTKIPMYFTASSLIMDGKPYFVGIGIDNTERKRNDAERTLLSTVIAQAEENVLITDDKRTIIYINPAFERSSGYLCEELKGQKLRALRSDQHEDGFYHTTKKILDRGEVWMGVIINKGKDGKNFEIEGTISPIRNTSGAITHFVAVGRNMKRFRRIERELQQAQKLDALGTLAGGIAHDFNNVLSAVMGFIEMEALDADAGSQTRYRMERALAACCRARDLIKQILAFSRQGSQERKPVEMAPIVAEALKMLRATLPTTIDMRLTTEAAHSVVFGNPTQIHQVIVNLCTNAAHAMLDTGGILKVSLADVEIDALEAFEHPDLQPGSYVRLVVEDTGYGMDRKTLDRIFEPFFTTKAPGEGTGIGLAVVHGIVKGHDGRIAAHSEPGKGSKFEIFLPGTGTAAASSDPPGGGIPTGNERILLVDDEEMLIDVVTGMLKILGYEVVSANRSLDALDIFRSRHEQFRLVITDLTMPEMTGMELAAEMLCIRGDIPIILSTGFTSAEIRKKAMTVGIREVMMKPFILQEIADTVRRVLDGEAPAPVKTNNTPSSKD